MPITISRALLATAVEQMLIALAQAKDANGLACPVLVNPSQIAREVEDLAISMARWAAFHRIEPPPMVEVS